MNEEVIVEKMRKSPPRGAGGAKKMRRYTAAEKLKAVRLHLEEGFTQGLVCQELGVCKSTLVMWLQAYRLDGEAGLQLQACQDPERNGCPRRSRTRSSNWKQQKPRLRHQTDQPGVAPVFLFTGQPRDGAAATSTMPS